MAKKLKNLKIRYDVIKWRHSAWRQNKLFQIKDIGNTKVCWKFEAHHFLNSWIIKKTIFTFLAWLYGNFYGWSSKKANYFRVVGPAGLKFCKKVLNTSVFIVKKFQHHCVCKKKVITKSLTGGVNLPPPGWNRVKSSFFVFSDVWPEDCPRDTNRVDPYFSFQNHKLYCSNSK